MKTKIVAVVAEGDLVVVVTPRELPNPKDPSTKYTRSWFDMWRFKGGRAMSTGMGRRFRKGHKPGAQHLLLITAHHEPETAWVGNGINVVTFNSSYAATPVTCLTNTDGTDEGDPVLARIGAGLASNRSLVGWRL